MRDPNQIEPTLEAMKQVWEKHPDLRLGKLLWALAGGDPFYLEYGELVEKAKAIGETRCEN